MKTEGEPSKLEAILNSAVVAIITIDTSGKIESVNPATERMFGYNTDELVGSNVRMLMPEPFRREHDGYLANYLSTGIKKIIGIGREVLGQRKDGSIFPIDLAVSEFVAEGRRYFAGIISDLSRRKQAEEALIESERRLAHSARLESIGKLSGGIAHDFNNLLTVVIGNLELIDMQIKSEKLRAMLREAQDAAELGAKLTERLLAFARRSHLEPQTVNLNALASSTTTMLRRTLGEHIALSTALSPNLWPTRIDPGQAESAIVNLAINARDAMPKGGTLAIETRNTIVDASFADMSSELVPGEYVQLSISDTGTGMSVETRSRAFEPFFTTKERGHGTGLGLSMVYGFAKQSGGHTTIYSELGHGTTINIYLPRAAGGQDANDTRIVSDERLDPRSARILVVEDDDRVRSLTVRRLKELGYEVESAPDGATAINMIRAGTRPDLIFTDLVMPGGMSGHDVIRQAGELLPDAKVLLTSGYAEDIVRGEELKNVRLLRKPYRLGDLRKAMIETLGNRK